METKQRLEAIRRNLTTSLTDINVALTDKGVTEAENVYGVAPKIEEVYEVGYNKGIEEAPQSDSYYDEFWDAFQNYGNETDYNHAFCGAKWTDELFDPKYDIKPTVANFFAYSAKITDFVNFGTRGRKIDFSNCYYYSQAWQNSKALYLPALNFTDSTQSFHLTYMCGFCYDLKSIEKITIGENTYLINSIFNSCSSLESVIFEGVIATNGLSVQWSELLSHESLMSIINCLADKSADTSGTVWTVTLGDTNKAKLTTEELAIAEDKGWTVN